ncbi:Beta-1,4-galactosyltransferase 2 [Bulinus truncatus]|nr:Beta-1,4-galactosyltransferase 2 [Bulinus truncatus]
MARIGSNLGKNIADVSQRNETVVCPDNPPSLIGHKAANITEVTKTELIKDGHLIPSNCTPRQKLALIFPYRNRSNHLHILLNNLIPLLIRQQADGCSVADQSTFNKGVLLNAGFSEADKVGSFDCYIVHEVDLIPLNDNNLYRCGDRPRHFTVAINKFNYRVHNKGFSVLRYNETIARYDMIKHARDEGNQENPLRHTLIKSSSKRQDADGVNTVKYKVLDIQTEQLYTWIKVVFNKTHLIQSAPTYIQDEMVQAQISIKP